jgi:hypothetical protein
VDFRPDYAAARIGISDMASEVLKMVFQKHGAKMQRHRIRFESGAATIVRATPLELDAKHLEREGDCATQAPLKPRAVKQLRVGSRCESSEELLVT